MHKKTITYKDFDGNKRTEDYYFHLTKAEVIMWMTTENEYTLDKIIHQLVEKNNGQKIMEVFEDLIMRSYGVKSLDGRRFTKSQEVKGAFKESEAYSALFMELVSDAKAASAFINGIMPKELMDQVNAEILKHPDGIPDELRDYLPGK